MSHPGRGAATSPLLQIYLNDHLAGATGGVELLRRAARNHRGDTMGPRLAELAVEVAEDLATLRQIMEDLQVPIQRYKPALGWLAEKVGRLKPNGRLMSRSPLSDVMELEIMRLGVEGKVSCWRTLRALADSDSRLAADRLDALHRRAEEQAERLEGLRTAAAASTFATVRRQR
jgi:hypothetical protein